MTGAPGAAHRDDAIPIVFFDGFCGLCDHTVAFLSARDRRRMLRFAPLQGETAAALLPAPLREELKSLVLVVGGRVHVESTAVLEAVVAMGGAWRLAGVLLLVPRVVRDAVYGVVARHRYRIFGTRDACRVPTPGERAYFLP